MRNLTKAFILIRAALFCVYVACRDRLRCILKCDVFDAVVMYIMLVILCGAGVPVVDLSLEIDTANSINSTSHIPALQRKFMLP